MVQWYTHDAMVGILHFVRACLARGERIRDTDNVTRCRSRLLTKILIINYVLFVKIIIISHVFYYG